MKKFQGALLPFQFSRWEPVAPKKRFRSVPTAGIIHRPNRGTRRCRNIGRLGNRFAGCGGGTWKITGTKTSGTIAMTDSSGKPQPMSIRFAAMDVSILAIPNLVITERRNAINNEIKCRYNCTGNSVFVLK